MCIPSIGGLLMAGVLNHPKLSNVEHFDLNCLPETVGFYNKWEFTTDLGELKHMRRHHNVKKKP